MEDKKENVSALVNICYGLVAQYGERAAQGEFNLEEAKKKAQERMSGFVYGKEGYIWIHDLEHRMIVHSKNPELFGKNLADIRDQNGKHLFREMNKAVTQNGEGFVEYIWPKVAGGKSYPKLAYVKLYKPWGWVIGTGIYVDDVMSTVWKISIGIGVVLIIISIVVTTTTFIIGGGFISRPVMEYGRKMQEFSSALTNHQGDLTGRLKVKSGDEIGRLAGDINKVLDSYGQMVEKMMLTTGKVVTTTGMLKENAGDMSLGAKSQASQSHRIATSTGEMSQRINDIARNASAASETSSQATEMAKKGKGVAEDAVETVNRVHISTAGLAEIIDKLNKKTGDIGTIVTVIKEIADQTNLLALNAAIEAARAGEQGRGFAVVADEVRKLAEKTIKATEEITGEIRSVQDESAMTTQRMSETAAEVTKADQSIKEVMNSLEGMSEAVMRVNDKIAQIATAVAEQSSAAEEVSRNIEVTSEISAETDIMAADVLKGTDKIVTVVSDLKKSFAGFKTSGSAAAQLEVVKGDIRSFLYRVGDSVSGKKKIAKSDLTDLQAHSFMQWFSTEGRELLGHLESFNKIIPLCERIHTLGKQAIKSAKTKDGQAQSLYEELVALVNRVQEDIERIQLQTKESKLDMVSS
ncbi:MAG TPA: methyl-accepting chemotaxis protein [Nitrospirota bacterium]|nr:methyl-accepting chemotaxis protein [Nitrospirota bacterium]